MATATILVIDDELFMRRLCDDMLSLRGFKVLTAENAKDGLAKLEKGGVDIILLDIMMPDLSGIEFLPVIKKADPEVFVIIITAHASLETAIEALKKGAYDYIRKPFRPHELYHSVDKAIARRRLELENKRLLQDLQGRVKELSTLNRVGKYIHSLLDIDRLLEKIVLSIAAVLGVEIVSVMLIDRATGEMAIRSATGLPDDVIKGTRQKVGTGIAGWVAEKGEPLLIDDIEKDARFSKLSNDVKYKTKSLLSIPLVTKEGVLGVVNANRKTSGEAFTEHDLQLLTTLASQAAAAIENAELYSRVQNFNRELEEKVRLATAELAEKNKELERLYRENQQNFMETLQALVKTLEARDEYTRNHSERVTRIAVMIAKQMGLPEARISALRIAGALHDIGKIGIDDAILKSAERLSPEQRKQMEEHPAIGARIIDPLNFLKPMKVQEIVLAHQERYDGSGYPAKLKGEAIPLEARILSVGDTYDAMMSRRRYRSKVFTHAEVLEELRRVAGTQLDPQAVEAILQIPEGQIRALYGEVGTPGAVHTIIVDCNRCGARFRIDGSKIPASGARVRCLKCQEPITVKPMPAATPASP